MAKSKERCGGSCKGLSQNKSNMGAFLLSVMEEIDFMTKGEYFPRAVVLVELPMTEGDEREAWEKKIEKLARKKFRVKASRCTILEELPLFSLIL
jgi:hypothetical protein